MRTATFLLAAAAALAVPLHFSNVFGSHMVLRAAQATPVWGWGNPGLSVSLTFNGQAYKSTSDAAGFWKVTLPAMPISFTPYTLTLTASSGETANITDVLFGVVIFCSGQSNMEFTTNAAANASEELAAANAYPYIRITSGPEQQIDSLNSITPNTTYNELAVTNLPWSVANNVSVGCLVAGCSGWNYMSAVCWFTLRDTFNMLGGTAPVGGISQTYGGTSIQWWSPASALAECPAAPGSACCNYGGTDSCLWNSQVFPFTIGPTGLDAVMWYQGEQNAGCGGNPQIDYYSCALPALINAFRTAFASPQLPFGLCQLAAWSANTPWFPMLRLVQVGTSAAVPNVFTVSTLDAGDPATGAVHSPYKQIVGYRAALGLQALAFKAPATPYMGPRYASSSVSVQSSTTTVTVTFDASTLYGGGVTLASNVTCPAAIPADACEAFALLLAPACVWIPPVTVTTVGGSLLLSVATNASQTVVATRGSFANWPLVEVFNQASLPADPWVANITGVANNPCPLLPPSPASPPKSHVILDAGMLLDVYESE